MFSDRHSSSEISGRSFSIILPFTDKKVVLLSMSISFIEGM